MKPYMVTVYFQGPRSSWQRRPVDAEIVFQQFAPWLWFARVLAKKQAGNTGRCGYVITRGGETVEHVEATDSEYAVL